MIIPLADIEVPPLENYYTYVHKTLALRCLINLLNQLYICTVVKRINLLEKQTGHSRKINNSIVNNPILNNIK